MLAAAKCGRGYTVIANKHAHPGDALALWRIELNGYTSEIVGRRLNIMVSAVCQNALVSTISSAVHSKAEVGPPPR